MNQDNTKPGPEGMKGSWRDRLGISKELPKIAEEFKEAPQKPQASEADDSEKPAGQPRSGAAVAKPAPMAPRPSAAELGDRLRQQREAAERMAEQRVAEAKERAVSEQRPQQPLAGQPQRPAGPVSRYSSPQPTARPRFTFAEEELRNARAEPSAPRAEPGRPRTVGQPAPPAPRPVFTADRQANQNDSRLRTPPPLPRPSAPPPPHARGQSGAGRVPPAPLGERPLQPPRPQRSGPQQGYDPYRRSAAAPARALDEPYGREDYHRHVQHADVNRSGAQFRGAHSRELGYVEEEGDDLFEDEQTYSPQARRRATAQDYTQAYREFEGEAVERRRTGPILILAALIAMGTLAAGMFFYRGMPGTSQTAAPPNVPVVAEPSEPVKTEPPSEATAEDSAPATQQQSMAPAPEAQTPAQKKQIYDRILGETTLEEQEQVLPSEEQPVPPGGQSQGFDADPLPLPMPPPPGDDQSGALEPPAPGQTTALRTQPAAEEGLQQASPAAANLESTANEPPAADTMARTVSAPAMTSAGASAQAPAPAVESIVPVSPVGSQAARAGQPPEEAVSQSATPIVPQPKPRATTAEQRIDSELAFAEQSSSASAASGGAGPIQIAPLTGGVANASGEATFAPSPSALPDLAEGSSALAKRHTMGARASDRQISAPNRNFNKARQVQVAEVETIQAEPITTQSIAPQAALTQSQPQPATIPEPAPAVPSEQASIAPALPAQTQPTHGTGTIFSIQLASYKSEADALAGFEQLRHQHGQIVGSLRPSVQKTELGASGTFYRLHLGSFASKQAAKNACTSLLAAGERDCIVKSR
jgi:hypothetical protein